MSVSPPIVVTRGPSVVRPPILATLCALAVALAAAVPAAGAPAPEPDRPLGAALAPVTDPLAPVT